VRRIQAGEQVEGGQGRRVNFLEIPAARVAVRGVGKQDLGKPANDGELILEVVTAPLVVGDRNRHVRISRQHDRPD